jgi:N-acetylmuramoyl-L-alanine amidase/putative methionine-R-sulfoxide reductase with GAF domain
MATTTSKPDGFLDGAGVPAWPNAQEASAAGTASPEGLPQKALPRDALQVLLAFSSLHEQVRRRRALAAHHNGFDSKAPVAEFEPEEQFVLDEVLQLVTQRAVAITGADGLAIALAENDGIVLRAAAGTVRPDVGARIERDSAFSGACFRTAEVFTCDDTETDPRVNVGACRKLGARSMVAVPLCGRRRVIGVLEAFSTWPFSFNESDVRNLTLLAELVVGALKPEDEDRFAQSAQAAATKLEPGKPAPSLTTAGSTASATPSTAASAAPAAPIRIVAPPQAPKPATEQPPMPVSTQPAKPKVDSVPTPAAQPAKPAIQLVPATSPAPSPKPEIKPTTATASAVAELFEAPKPAEAGDKLPKHADPELTFGQATEPESNRSWIVFALIGIVIVSAFAAGVIWKIKSAQVGNEIVQSEPSPEQQANSGAAIQPAAANAPAASDAADSAAPGNSAAAPQELSKFPRVTGVRHWSSSDSSTVVLDLEDQVQYEPGHLTNPDRVYFDLRDTQLAPDLVGKTFDGDALLSHIRIAQPVPGMTRIVLEAKGSTMLSRPQVSLERDPYRLVIEVTKAGASPKGAVDLFPNAADDKSKMAIVVPPPTREDLQLRARVPKMRIVVDAGHGGWDLGTVGRRGLLEKDLVLEIAQRLGKLLESRLGSDVIYTRQDDNYIPLDNRAEIANDAQADLFVSVHANYSDLPSARGVETYYSNFFSAPGSKDLAQNAPNSTMPAPSPADLHDRVEQSRRLAASVQRSLYGTLSVHNPGLRDRGIKEAGFVVLTESAMPGILAEVSFVSSPTDEQKLRSDGYREQIAEALYKGIARYAASSKGLKVASAAR